MFHGQLYVFILAVTLNFSVTIGNQGSLSILESVGGGGNCPGGLCPRTLDECLYKPRQLLNTILPEMRMYELVRVKLVMTLRFGVFSHCFGVSMEQTLSLARNQITELGNAFFSFLNVSDRNTKPICQLKLSHLTQMNLWQL